MLKERHLFNRVQNMQALQITHMIISTANIKIKSEIAMLKAKTFIPQSEFIKIENDINILLIT